MSDVARSIATPDEERQGFADAVSGISPDSDRDCDPDYLRGFRQGLLIKIRWAKEDLECFDAENDHHDPICT